MVLDLGLEEE